ncbi:MAG TPA: flagellar protein FliT [Chromatiaceae bacterium]|nr:flagellar protein FliT [Chromatiaceae bacterium]
MTSASAIQPTASGISPERGQALDALLDASLEMLRLAESREWLEVIQSGVMRKHMIDEFFATPVVASEENDTARVLRRIIQINAEIEELALQSRGGVGDDIGAIQQGRRAVTAYAENTAAANLPGVLE